LRGIREATAFSCCRAGRPLHSPPSADAFELEGYGGAPLPCVLHTSDEARGSAVVLPGGARAGNRLGGTPARPDLNYVRQLLLGLGLSVLEVWWDTDTAPDGEEGEEWLAANAAAAFAAAGGARVGVGRSWGTRALAKLALGGSAPSTTVWIAPLLGHPEVRAALERCGESACVVTGTADGLVPAPDLRAVEAAGVTVVRIDGANHGFEVDGPAASARALAAALDELHAFLERSL
jgi:hypothetical protein